ncbi:hypothetical protein NBRC116602_22770 [Hyphomicrobiales bacterium 4NK60-0047b]|jgi:hypothetical protein
MFFVGLVRFGKVAAFTLILEKIGIFLSLQLINSSDFYFPFLKFLRFESLGIKFGFFVFWV